MLTNKQRMRYANYRIDSFPFIDIDGKTYWQVNVCTDDYTQTDYFTTEQDAIVFIDDVDREAYSCNMKD